MNNRSFISISILAAFITLVSASCNLQPCKEYELAPFYIDVIPELRVVDANGNGIANQNAQIRIRKYHCEGPNHWGEFFEQAGTTNGDGWFYYPGGVQIKISNERDKIEVYYDLPGVTTATKTYYPDELVGQPEFTHLFTLN